MIFKSKHRNWGVILNLFAISLLPWAAQAKDLSLAIQDILPLHRVVVFSGAFDPVHKGHQAAIDAAFKNGADWVYVHLDAAYDSENPFKTPEQWRQLGLGKVFEKSERVITSPKPSSEVLNELGAKHVQLIRLIGSDVARSMDHLFKEGKKPFPEDEWWIVWRDSQNGDVRQRSFKFHSGGQPQILHFQHLEVDPPLGAISSVEIRSKKDEEIKDQVDPIVLDWRKSFVYFTKYNSRQYAEKDALEKQIKARILDILRSRDFPSEELSVVSGASSGTQGISGNLIFLVKDRDGATRYVAKVFVTKEKKTQFSDELESFKRLSQLLKGSQLPQVIYSSGETEQTRMLNEYSMILMRVAPGISVEGLLRDFASASAGHKPQKMEIIKTAMSMVGEVIAQIHSYSSKEKAVIDGEVERELNKDFPALKGLGNEAELGLDPDFSTRLLQRVADISARFRENPGYLSLNHYDPSPSNFFYLAVERDASLLTSLDTGGLMRSIKGERAIGFPARDLYQFYSSFYFLTVHKKVGLSREEIQEAFQAFLASYDRVMNQTQTPVTREARNFFKAFWATKGIKLDLNFLKFETNPELRQKLLQDIRRCVDEILEI